MAEITTRSCDRHGTLKATQYQIEIKALVPEADYPTHSWVADLSDRAYNELVAKIEAGIKPPATRKPKEGGGDGK